LAIFVPNAFATSAFVSSVHGFGRPAEAVGASAAAATTASNRRTTQILTMA